MEDSYLGLTVQHRCICSECKKRETTISIQCLTMGRAPHCKVCLSKICRAKSKKNSWDFIKERFEAAGVEIYSRPIEYLNANSPLNCVCVDCTKETGRISYNMLKRGFKPRCEKCKKTFKRISSASGENHGKWKGGYDPKKYSKSEKGRKQRNEHRKWKQLNDPITRLEYLLRKREGSAFRRGTKTGSAIRDLGCTLEYAMSYWESLPTWNTAWSWLDHGVLFHLDHIKALAFFDLTEREQVIQAFNYKNIQPLSTEDHKKKTREDIRLIKWLKKVR